LTSDVWHYLDVLSKDVKGKLVRYGARCKFYKKKLSGKSTSGTGHLLRHVKSCLRKQQAATSSNQTNFYFAPDGRVTHFEYSPVVARTELCRLLARLDLPLILDLNVRLGLLLHLILMFTFLVKWIK
jgi:hypothetical protein